jgi:hypothetical protein
MTGFPNALKAYSFKFALLAGSAIVYPFKIFITINQAQLLEK